MAELALEDAESYRRYLRMDTATFCMLADAIRSKVKKQDTAMRQAIFAEERLAVTLRVLVTGDSYMSLSWAFRIERHTVGRIVPEVCRALYDSLRGTHLRTPSTEAEWNRVVNEFVTRWNFPNCIGAVDGKHVVIVQPAGTGSHHFNYNGTFSTVLLAVADANLKFLYVDVGTNGRVSDVGIWGKSTMKIAIENGSLRAPAGKVMGEALLPYMLVGDDAFPLKRYLMKPYVERNLDASKRIFNYRLSRSRRVVENAFGMLSAVFRVFRRPIAAHLCTAKLIVVACCVLHNLLMTMRTNHDRFSSPEMLDREDLVNGAVIEGNWRAEGPSNALLNLAASKASNSSAEAKNIRGTLREYFVNAEKVPWQDRFSYV